MRGEGCGSRRGTEAGAGSENLITRVRRASLLLAVMALLAPAGAAAAPASLVDVEDEVMCVTCNVPLNIAESPQAERQRAFIRGLIARGNTKEQVKAALVAEYGPDVLALPDEDGFGVTAYVVPVALGIILLAGPVILIPRWRRRARPVDAPATSTTGGASPTAADERRLDEDLARYDR